VQKGTHNDTGLIMSRHLHQLFVIYSLPTFGICSKNDMIIHHMNVITALLSGTLDEELYM